MTDIIPFDQSDDIEECPQYDYGQLDPEIYSKLMEHEKQIDLSFRRTNDEAIKIGQHLIEVKALLPHGHFTPWYKSRYGMSQQTASILMRKAKGTYKPLLISGLDEMKQLEAPENPHDKRWKWLRSAEHKASVKLMYDRFRTEHGMTEEAIESLENAGRKIDKIDFVSGLEMQTELSELWEWLLKRHDNDVEFCHRYAEIVLGYPWKAVELFLEAEHPSLVLLYESVDIVKHFCEEVITDNLGDGRIRMYRKLDEEKYAKFMEHVEE